MHSVLFDSHAKKLPFVQEGSSQAPPPPVAGRPPLTYSITTASQASPVLKQPATLQRQNFRFCSPPCSPRILPDGCLNYLPVFARVFRGKLQHLPVSLDHLQHNVFGREAKQVPLLLHEVQGNLPWCAAQQAWLLPQSLERDICRHVLQKRPVQQDDLQSELWSSVPQRLPVLAPGLQDNCRIPAQLSNGVLKRETLLPHRLKHDGLICADDSSAILEGTPVVLYCLQHEHLVHQHVRRREPQRGHVLAHGCKHELSIRTRFLGSELQCSRITTQHMQHHSPCGIAQRGHVVLQHLQRHPFRGEPQRLDVLLYGHRHDGRVGAQLTSCEL
mmetsp:Transcript_54293/g.126411  ORF Transcript_54293/g.126411 Transcript_54293/m.126411 type:complete len:330 (+) Transcript_54293:236-1225(+)